MVWVGPLHSMEEMNCGLVSFCVAEHAPPAAGGWSCCPQPLNWSNKRKQNNLSIQFNSSFLTALGRADKKKNELMGLPRSCWLLGEPLVHSIPLAFIYWFINKVDSINKFISFHSISLHSSINFSLLIQQTYLLSSLQVWWMARRKDKPTEANEVGLDCSSRQRAGPPAITHKFINFTSLFISFHSSTNFSCWMEERKGSKQPRREEREEQPFHSFLLYWLPGSRSGRNQLKRNDGLAARRGRLVNHSQRRKQSIPLFHLLISSTISQRNSSCFLFVHSFCLSLLFMNWLSCCCVLFFGRSHGAGAGP